MLQKQSNELNRENKRNLLGPPSQNEFHGKMEITALDTEVIFMSGFATLVVL